MIVVQKRRQREECARKQSKRSSGTGRSGERTRASLNSKTNFWASLSRVIGFSFESRLATEPVLTAVREAVEGLR